MIWRLGWFVVIDPNKRAILGIMVYSFMYLFLGLWKANPSCPQVAIFQLVLWSFIICEFMFLCFLSVEVPVCMFFLADVHRHGSLTINRPYLEPPLRKWLFSWRSKPETVTRKRWTLWTDGLLYKHPYYQVHFRSTSSIPQGHLFQEAKVLGKLLRGCS